MLLARIVDRWERWRDQLLMSARFQRRANSIPVINQIGRRRAQALFDINAGFVYFQILNATVQTGLCRILIDGPVLREQLPHKISLSNSATEVLLRAAISLDLVERRSNDRIGLGPLGSALVSNPGVEDMVRHHDSFYSDIADPVALLNSTTRQTLLNKHWHYASDAESSSADEVADYSMLMANSQPALADEILASVKLTDASHLMDVGGGQGTFIASAAAHWSHLRFTLIDLPAVAQRAQRVFAEAGLESRTSTMGIDMVRDPLPRGADVATLIRVLHDHDDEPAQSIVQNIFDALPSGGRIVVAEPMAETRGSGRVGDAYFGLYFWAMGSGRTRSCAELREYLRAAGFTKIVERRTSLPMILRILEASKPAKES